VKVNGFEYYEIVLCYVGDILSILHDPRATLQALVSAFKPKDDKIEEPEMYLGAQLGNMTVDELECWKMSAEKYVGASVKNSEDTVAKRGLRLPTKCYNTDLSTIKWKWKRVLS
jgi:hypothetical protein